MVVIAIVLFMGLALGEDYANGLLRRWRGGQAKATASDDATNVAKKYVQVLPLAYDKTSPKLLENVATEKQITQVRLLMAYNHWELKKKFVGNLKSQAIDKVEVKGKKATVTATEVWDYHYLVEETGKVVDKTTDSYKVSYKLVKQGKEWFIDAIESKDI